MKNLKKIKEGLLKELDNAITSRKRTRSSEDRDIELIIIHALDIIDEISGEQLRRELKNKYNEL